ncbi:hypothetical protein SDC9_09132 [bioreactor metagenome]|uniref:Uncharacterized protein n=1 Tax=bioreactor metagenome TaxID=1076179 RepID=A0A644T987_9ZZZZ
MGAFFDLPERDTFQLTKVKPFLILRIYCIMALTQ